MKSALTLGPRISQKRDVIHGTILAAGLLLNTASYALDPVQGFYGGVFIGGSLSSGVTFNLTKPTSQSVLINGKLSYSPYGNGGGELGYRINQFRVESELFYNYSPYKSITLVGHKYTSRKSGSGFRYKGQTGTGAIMINGIFDAFFVGEDSDLVPYVGLGIGYARVQNSIKFYCNNVNIGTQNIAFINNDKSCALTPNPNGADSNLKVSTSAGAAQGILGISYYMDDYVMFGLDVRQFSTRNIKEFNHKVQFTTLNLSFNGAFDYG